MIRQLSNIDNVFALIVYKEDEFRRVIERNVRIIVF